MNLPCTACAGALAFCGFVMFLMGAVELGMTSEDFQSERDFICDKIGPTVWHQDVIDSMCRFYTMPTVVGALLVTFGLLCCAVGGAGVAVGIGVLPGLAGAVGGGVGAVLCIITASVSLALLVQPLPQGAGMPHAGHRSDLTYEASWATYYSEAHEYADKWRIRGTGTYPPKDLRQINATFAAGVVGCLLGGIGLIASIGLAVSALLCADSSAQRAPQQMPPPPGGHQGVVVMSPGQPYVIQKPPM